MLFLIHGDNTVASRQHLNQLIDQAKQKGVKDIVRLEGKRISKTDLIQSLETQSLFGTDRLIIIENLLSRPRSKDKEKLTTYFKDIYSTLATPPQTILWEPKPATVPQIKSVGNPKHQQYKISKTLFTFLDSIKVKSTQQTLSLFQETIKQEAVELVFAMLTRQIRLLIQVKDNAPVKMAPWQIGKLKSQATQFTLPQLLKLHQQLLQLDHQNKTGQSLLDLKTSLDLIITQL